MIRPYKKEDKEFLMELIKLNIPMYFDPEEEHDLEEYLEQHREKYYVVEVEDEILGCGGINFLNDRKLVRISWDIFHPKSQGKGLGTELTKFRIEEIKKEPKAEIIQVRTTGQVYKFYEKVGFELKEVVKDFWAKGFDLYRMEISLR